MDIWGILGIPETEDLDLIRRAYANRLKEVHPEEDLEGFQRLHTAYQTIRKLVRGVAPDLLKELQPQKQPVAQPATAAALSSELLDVIQRNPMEDHPAVAAFQALYTGTRRRERTQWDLYFTGPEFPSVWRDGEFTALLAQIVVEHKVICPPSKEFQTALAVAYQMEPVSGPDGVEFYPALGMGFEGIEAICTIAALGPPIGPLRGNDWILACAYGDYLQLLEMAERGWTDEDLCQLDSLPQYHMVLLWNSWRRNEANTCALLRFDDRSRNWEALISDRDAYMNTDHKLTRYLPFRTGKLASYRLHSAPKKLVMALVALLNGRAPDPGQWSSEIYLNNALQRYYVARRTVGGFSYDRHQTNATFRKRGHTVLLHLFFPKEP